MPWSETTPMDQKTQFIADYLRKRLSITELCELYGISRKTGYKFIDRYLRLGPQGLEELSRRPVSCPNRTPAHIEQAIVAARQSYAGEPLTQRRINPVRNLAVGSSGLLWVFPSFSFCPANEAENGSTAESRKPAHSCPIPVHRSPHD